MARKAKRNSKSNYWLVVTPIIILTFAVISFMKLGVIGSVMDNMFRYLFGDGFYILCLFDLAYYIYYLLYRKHHGFKWNVFISVCIFNLLILLFYSLQFNKELKGFEILSHYFVSYTKTIFTTTNQQFLGGLLGSFIYSLFSFLLDPLGTIVLMVSLAFIAILLLVPYRVYRQSAHKIKDKTEEIIDQSEKRRIETKKTSFRNIEIDKDESEVVETKTLLQEFKEVKESPKLKVEAKKEKKEEVSKPVLPIRSNEDYTLPGLQLLNELSKTGTGSINKSAANIKGERVVEILNSFDVPCELSAIHIGPSVTKFEIKPDSGVKISKILGLQNNIKMELAAKSIRIEAPIPGISAVGIEIPNVEASPVPMLDLMQNIPSNKLHEPLLCALGRDIMGKPIYCELNKMPHLLIAGATGSGKSVCTNAIISSILMRCHPDDVKLMLIDPKRVEFLPYKDVPHLFWPVIDDSNKAANALKRAVAIMEERYQLLAETGVRNIESYNQKVIEFNKTAKEEEKMFSMPYMVIIIDELADLMIVAGKDVEASIQQITQKARAAGIHLIVATQRPSTDVITGVIKANIPSRIAFAVASQIDSRTILDAKGAEDLLGKGDMLYVPMGTPNPTRVQGVFITDEEIARIADFTRSQKAPNYEDSYYELESINMPGSQGGIMAKFDDDLYDEVKEYIISIQKCSASIVQRRFAVGYNRAARLVDMLEENGVVGPAQGSKPREVYYKNEES